MPIQKWEHFFKPEVRSSGRRYFTTGNISFSQLSDTEVQSYIRGSTSIKVILKSKSISSEEVTAFCTCPNSRKGIFCKHIWAALLITNEKRPEFFDEKSELEIHQNTTDSVPQNKFARTAPRPALSSEQIASRDKFKIKQKEYRKSQYEKNKQRLKDLKPSQKTDYPPGPQLPKEVQAALLFFTENGIPLEDSLDSESISNARKKLSRIFHPDKGGTHEEVLQLNTNCETLLRFVAPKTLKK
jgi:hypothetical protein